MITTQKLKLPCYMTDLRSRMRATAFMDLAQQIGEDDAEAGGFGFSFLRARGLAWVLARQRVEFYSLPQFKDELELQTWHRGVNGPFYVRDYKLLGADGKVAVASSSSWVLMDLASRTMVMPGKVDLPALADAAPGMQAIEGYASKVMPPRGLPQVKVGERAVVFSDIDYNRHVNNVRYIGWAVDVLPMELLEERPLRGLTINFNHEVHPGETVSLYLQENPSGEYFVEGRVEDRQAFIVRLEV